MLNQSFYIESNANKTLKNTIQKKEKSVVPIVAASEFVRDSGKPYFFYLRNISLSQTETPPFRDSLWE